MTIKVISLMSDLKMCHFQSFTSTCINLTEDNIQDENKFIRRSQKANQDGAQELLALICSIE